MLQNISMLWAFHHKPVIKVYGGTLLGVKKGKTKRAQKQAGEE